MKDWNFRAGFVLPGPSFHENGFLRRITYIVLPSSFCVLLVLVCLLHYSGTTCPRGWIEPYFLVALAVTGHMMKESVFT